jgi:HlyD family secretion protein
MKRLTLFGLLVLATLTWIGGTAQTAPPGAGDLPSPVPRTQVVALGRVEPVSEEMRIAAAMTGRLASVPVEEGRRVVRGEVLATLENADHGARVGVAEAALAVAKASLERVRNGARLAERQEAAAEVDERAAKVTLAQEEFKRQQGLVARRAGSQQDLDRVRGELDMAQAQWARARFRHEIIDGPVRADDLAKAEAEVALAEARVAEARAVYDKSFVRSPVDGQVLQKLRRVGEQVSELGDTPILVLGDTSRLRVRAEVDEADIAWVFPEQSAYVKADAYGERRFPGRVSRLGTLMGRKSLRNEQPMERTDTRVLEVLIDLEPGTQLPVGLRVDSFLLLDAKFPVQ